ncbi:hypothetical protein HRbin01_00451 [archaeon HR01]|nr:hypothetical protein HRbin01_00451 [archaeon HR01]
MSYLIPHLGSLLETHRMRRILRIVAAIIHIGLAAGLTVLINGYLDLLPSLTLAVSISALSYFLVEKVFL